MSEQSPARTFPGLLGRGPHRRSFAAALKSKLYGIGYHLKVLGFRRTCEAAWSRAVDAWFDRRYGVETGNWIPVDGLKTSSENLVHVAGGYEPTATRVWKALLSSRLLPLDTGFADYGCGKGRVLLMAADARFRRVLGVEFSPELCEIARRNAARYRALKPGLPPIDVVEADASRFEPPADVGIFYFYNPFTAVLMTEALARIRESAQKHPRDVWIVYNTPNHRSAIDAMTDFVLEHEIDVNGHRCLLFCRRAASEVAAAAASAGGRQAHA